MTTTPRDLLIVAMDMPSSRTVERGDLSLALAGAELIDLLRDGAVALAEDRSAPGGDRLVPGGDGSGEADESGEPRGAVEPVEPVEPVESEKPVAPESAATPADGGRDRLLDEAAASVAREEPYDALTDWLWRRGRGLAAAYLAAFEEEGLVEQERSRRWGLVRSQQKVLVDSPTRERAGHRWAADEPVLAALAATIGILDRRAGDHPEVSDEVATTVLAAVNDAVAELADERQRRAHKLDDAAVTNYRRGY